MTMETTKGNIYDLETLQKRKAELASLCKEKEKEMGEQIEYISDNLGSIALRTFIGRKGKKESGTKSEIISLLVSEGVEAALDIQQDPHHFKDKLVGFVKKASSGIINLLIK
jgi:hypothetical protein